jgi:DNA-binding MltR family transcriptional regulator
VAKSKATNRESDAIEKQVGEELASLKPIFSKLVAVLHTDTHNDRGYVMVCGAVLDRALEKLIRRKLVDLSQATDEELHFLLTQRPQPPLGSAGIRARVARVLGVISKDVSTALSRMFDLRNRFAHDEIAPVLDHAMIKPIFDAVSIADKARNDVALCMKHGSSSPQQLLQIATILLLHRLEIGHQAMVDTATNAPTLGSLVELLCEHKDDHRPASITTSGGKKGSEGNWGWLKARAA